MKWISQTLVGTGTVTERKDTSNTTTHQNVSFSVDYEKLNCRYHVNERVTVNGEVVDETETGFIFRSSTGTVANMFKKGATEAPACNITRSTPKLLARTLKGLFETMILPIEAFEWSCIDHHDDVDVFRVKWGSAGLGALLQADWELTDASLVKRERSVTTLKGYESEATTEYTKVQRGGPTEEQLTPPESWNCKDIRAEAGVVDLLDLLDLLAHHSVIPHMLKAMLSASTEIVV